MMYNEVRKRLLISGCSLTVLFFDMGEVEVMSEMKAGQEDVSSGSPVRKTEDDPGFPEGEAGEKMLERMNEHHGELRSWGFSNISWRPGMEILDVGCGGGAAVKDMLRLSEGSIVKGVDYSDTSIELSRKLNAEEIEYERCLIEKADAAKLPYVDKAFDLVTAIETVYFWKDPAAAFREIRRVIRPGGQFVVLMEACEPAIEETGFDTPMRIYSEDELLDMMKNAGFASCESKRGEGENIMVTGTK